MRNKSLETIIGNTLTQDIMDLLHEAITNAVENGKIFEANHPNAKPRTISSFINDEMCSQFVYLSSKNKNIYKRIHFINTNGAFKISIDNGAIILRLKKMTSKGLTSNIVTQPVLEFEQINLFQDDSISLNAGYYLKHNGLSYEILISHPNGLHKIDWCHPISHSNNNIKEIPSTTPLQASTGQRKRKLLPRKDALNHAKSNKS